MSSTTIHSKKRKSSGKIPKPKHRRTVYSNKNDCIVNDHLTEFEVVPTHPLVCQLLVWEEILAFLPPQQKSNLQLVSKEFCMQTRRATTKCVVKFQLYVIFVKKIKTFLKIFSQF